jgi:Cu2+-exporting ATPase
MIGTILITGGILYIIVKAYRGNKNISTSGKLPNGKNSKVAHQRFIENSTVVFSGERRQQMKEMAGGRYLVKSEAEKRVDRALIVAGINMVFVGMSFFFPPLIWLTVPAIVYTSIPTYEHAYNALVNKKRLSSYILDAMVVTGGLIGQYFFAISVGVWMGLIGLKLTYQSENNTKRTLSNLFGEQPRFVWIITDDKVELEIPFEALQVGDTIVVNAGQSIPIDGIIKAGFASIDQHKLTGESQPVECGVGDPVLAATIVLAGKLQIKVEKTGQETVAMQIGKILDKTADFKDSMRSRGELLADRSVPITVGLFMFALPVLGSNAALGVLANKFGSKIRAFGPASVLVFLNLACQRGILIKDGRSLELLNEIDTVVFDKTGTLTLEQPTVGKIHTCNGISEDDILKYAAAAEHGQTHPVAKAILKAVYERKLQLPKIDDAKYEIGYGIQANLADRVVQVGSYKLMNMENITIPPEMRQIQENCHEQGNSLVYVAFNKQLAGMIELHATIRPETKGIIKYLHQHNISVYIISGDHEEPTKKLAQALGIDNYFANTLPENKARLVEELRKDGKSICFVGDGINDTIALKKANVSVSLNGATTIATDTAQIVLMDGTLKHIPQLFEVAKDFTVNMKHNMLISTVPTAIGLTGIFFFHWGFLASVLLSQSAMFLGIGNTMLPLFKQQSRNSE